MKTAVVCQTLVKFNMFTFFISYTMPFIVFSLNEWAENTKRWAIFRAGGREVEDKPPFDETLAQR